MSSITTIPGLPTFATPSEHTQLTQTTPSTFDALPPVLRCRVENVSITVTGIEGRSEWTGLKATLLLTEREVAFYVEERGESLIVPYKVISLHALSRAEGQPGSIYCQLDESLEQAEQAETEDDASAPELVIVPEDQTTLDQIFEALSMCASLHPSGLPSDPNDDDGFVFDGDEAGGEGEGEGDELSSLGRGHFMSELGQNMAVICHDTCMTGVQPTIGPIGLDEHHQSLKPRPLAEDGCRSRWVKCGSSGQQTQDWVSDTELWFGLGQVWVSLTSLRNTDLNCRNLFPGHQSLVLIMA